MLSLLYGPTMSGVRIGLEEGLNKLSQLSRKRKVLACLTVECCISLEGRDGEEFSTTTEGSAQALPTPPPGSSHALSAHEVAEDDLSLSLHLLPLTHLALDSTVDNTSHQFFYMRKTTLQL